MGLGINARAYLDELALTAAPPVDQMTVEEARLSTESTADRLFGAKDEIASIVDCSISGPRGPIPVRLYNNSPYPSEPVRVLLYFHGGGWVFGSLGTHDGVCRALANRAGCAVVAIDYRLAPENKFPAAVDDAWASLKWAVGQAIGHKPCIAVAGDSSGGNLAAVVALLARDAGIDLSLQLLVYPVTDCHMNTQSYQKYESGFGLTRTEMEWFVGHYLRSGSDRDDPRASPLLHSDLSAVAPAIVITPECDVLRDEAEAYVERLRGAGVPVQYKCYEGLIHGFYRMGAVFNETQQALQESADALRKAFSDSQGSSAS